MEFPKNNQNVSKKIKKRKSINEGDRFIPNRKNSNFNLFEIKQMEFLQEKQHKENILFKKKLSSNNSIREQILRKNLSRNSKEEEIFKFNNKLIENFTQEKSKFTLAASKPKRTIDEDPFRVLDAPEIFPDFYSNCLDWSNKNYLSVILDQTIYMWNGFSGKVIKLMTKENEEYYYSKIKIIF